MKNSKFLILLASLVLCVSVLFMGVVAARNTSLTGGGTVTFVADGIYANVSGSIEGAKEGTITLDQFEINSEIGEGFQSDWLQESLNFNSSADEIEMKITIENLAPDRTIWAKITDQNANVENLVKLIEPERVLEIPASTTKTFNIVFMVVNNNLSTTSSYDYRIDISRDDLTLTQEETGLNFETDLSTFGYEAEANVVTASGLTTEDRTTPKAINVPSFVKIDGAKYTVKYADVFTLAGYDTNDDIYAVSTGEAVEIIGYASFKYCENLSRVNFSAVKEIRGEALMSGSKIEYLNWGTQLQSVTGSYGVVGCKVESLYLPATLTEYNGATINKMYFPNLKEIIIEEGNQLFYLDNECLVRKGENGDTIWCRIGNAGYDGNGKPLFPANENVSGVLEFAYYNLSIPNNPGGYSYGIYVPGSLVDIPRGAFKNITNVGYIRFDEGVQSIDDHNFLDCEGITGVSLPSSLTRISTSCFAGNTFSFTVAEGNTKYFVESGLLYENTTEGKKLVLCRLQNITLPNDLVIIGSGSLDEYQGSLVLPESVTTINGYGTFGEGLTSINIPASVTTLDDYVFVGCKSLVQIVIDSETIANAVTTSSSIGDAMQENYELKDNFTLKIKNTITLSENVLSFLASNFVYGSVQGDYKVYTRNV